MIKIFCKDNNDNLILGDLIEWTGYQHRFQIKTKNGYFWIREKQIIAIGDDAISLFEKREEEINSSKEYKDFETKEAIYQEKLMEYDAQYQILSNEFHKRFKELEAKRAAAVQALDEKIGFSKIQKERDLAKATFEQYKKEGF